jgi:hypothetical protein
MLGSRVLLGAASLLLVAGCASSDEPAGSTSPSEASPAAPTADNGSVFASFWDEDVRIMRYPIRSDGTVGDGVLLLEGAAVEETFPAVIDGVGDAVATGTFEIYWTADVAVRSGSGEVLSETEADRWCGGEGLGYSICVLLDERQLARTSELGGEGPVEATLTVSSLQDGSTVKELGPFPGLYMVLGTSDAGQVMLASMADAQADPLENQPGTVQRLDLASGELTDIGEHPADWAPLCAIGTDSVLGFTVSGTPTAQVVGPAEIAGVQWSEDEETIGCSADGKYLYLQNFPQPPDSEEDTEPPNPSTTLDRITLADGSRESVLVLDPGVSAGPITR